MITLSYVCMCVHMYYPDTYYEVHKDIKKKYLTECRNNNSRR